MKSFVIDIGVGKRPSSSLCSFLDFVRLHIDVPLLTVFDDKVGKYFVMFGEGVEDD